MSTTTRQTLAIHGGPRAVTLEDADTFRWPIIIEEDEQAVLEVLRTGQLSALEVTQQFEDDCKAYFGVPYCLAHPNGTASLLGAMYACGVGHGDEIICPSMTFWASALPVFALGGTVVFADCHPDTLCLDPEDIEHRITPRTKAIMVVHYCAYPADMDAIMAIAERHGLKVIEDVSHSQGALYKGRMTGSIGHVGAMSLMAQKSLVAGEAGLLTTHDRGIYERAIAFAHYARHDQLTEPDLVANKGLPLGGVKGRLNQLASALGRSQLKRYPARIQEIQEAMNYFWDLLDGCPGVKAHRPPKDSGSTMGGWYAAKGLYRSDELGGLPLERFCEAVRAEGSRIGAGANLALHLHPVFNTADIYGHGMPTRLANADRDLRQPEGSLPVTESVPQTVYAIPHFIKYSKALIQQHAQAYRKTAENADKLR